MLGLKNSGSIDLKMGMEQVLSKGDMLMEISFSHMN